MRLDRILGILIFFCLVALPGHARADWINLTGAETSPIIAEIYILDDHVKLALGVYIGDLTTFHHLVPDSWLKDANIKRPPPTEGRRKKVENLTAWFLK